MKNTAQKNKTQDFWEAGTFYQTRTGQLSSPSALPAALLSSQMFTDCC